MSTYATRCAALRQLLADGKEHSGAELERVGGRRYGARIHSIRRGEDGLPALQVDCDVRGSESYWTARPYSEGEAPPSPRASRAELEAELARVRAELETLKRVGQLTFWAVGG